MSVGEAVLVVIGVVVCALIVMDWLEKRKLEKAAKEDRTVRTSRVEEISRLYTQIDMDHMRDLWSTTIREQREEIAGLRSELALVRHEQSELIREMLVPKTMDLSALVADEFEDPGPDLPEDIPDWTDDFIPEQTEAIPPPPFPTP